MKIEKTESFMLFKYLFFLCGFVSILLHKTIFQRFFLYELSYKFLFLCKQSKRAHKKRFQILANVFQLKSDPKAKHLKLNATPPTLENVASNENTADNFLLFFM